MADSLQGQEISRDREAATGTERWEPGVVESTGLHAAARYPGTLQAMDGSSAVVAMETAASEAAGVYPITPSTQMGEGWADAVAKGKTNVHGRRLIFFEPEGEHAAAAVAAGMSLVGLRSANFSAGQGVAYMHESLYAAVGKRLTYVLNIACRAITKQSLNIHCGHDDYHSVDDTGFFQLFAKDVQEVADLNLIAHRIAELSLNPGICAQDGFLTSHVIESLRLPEPHFFFDHIVELTEQAFAEFAELTGRRYARASGYRVEDAEYLIVGQGSLMPNAEVVCDYLRDARGLEVGAVNLTMFRPFPSDLVARLLRGKRGVVVLERVDQWRSPRRSRTAARALAIGGFPTPTCPPFSPGRFPTSTPAATGWAAATPSPVISSPPWSRCFRAGRGGVSSTSGSTSRGGVRDRRRWRPGRSGCGRPIPTWPSSPSSGPKARTCFPRAPWPCESIPSGGGAPSRWARASA
jgi:pyruvate/2-oxoacid:ferredoxin oxidoreductase alpha subunit